MKQPLFITGLPRCGSSWAGSVLGHDSTVRYVYEPFNGQWTPALRGRLGYFRYLPASARPGQLIRDATDRAFQGKQSMRQLARAAYRGYLRAALRRHRPVLVKDPTAVLMTEWLARHAGARVVILSRHPCGFASSIASLGWDFRVERLLQQERLMNEHLGAYEATLRAAAGDPWTGRGAFWAAVHSVLARQMKANTDWQAMAFEDLCRDPAGQFQQLARSLGLELGEEGQRFLELSSSIESKDSGSTLRRSATMAEVWKERLSPGQADAVLGVVREFETGRFYR